MAIEGRKYTKINQAQVLEDLSSILQAKEGALADLGQSSYGRTLLELFAGNSDLNAAWIEAAFGDSFLETATSPQAVYVGARSLGYSVRRPVPAKAGLGISLKRTGVYPNVRVSIPKGTQFSYGGQTLTAIDDMEFTFDRNDPTYQDGLMKLSSGRPVLAEGTFKTVNFFSDVNQNQEFIIPDATFSDWFGYNDPNYIDPDTQQNRLIRFTTISSDASLIDNPNTLEGLEERMYWRVSRRGFHDPTIEPASINDIDEFIEDSASNKTVNYTALVTSANDGRVKIEFSDGVISAIPYGRIDVTYFSTNGELGNLLNVSGSNLNTETTDILITQLDGTESDLSINDLNIALTTDIRGGLNIEPLESIRKNASQIYNSLDSLGNRNSYSLYLHRIADIKYANAFGEDILNKIQMSRQNDVFDIRYSNIVRFTVLKDLYREKEGSFFVTDPFEYYIEGYKVNGLTYLWDYDYTDLPETQVASALESELRRLKTRLRDFKIVRRNGKSITPNDFVDDIIRGVVRKRKPPTIFTSNITPKDFAVVGSELDSIMNSLNTKGYLTLGSGQHQYVHPIVHELSMNIDVILFEGSNSTDIKTKIINSVYSYLKESTQFASPIYRSKIECLIQRFPEVAGLNLHFKEKQNAYQGLDLRQLEWFGEETSQLLNQEGLSIEGLDATLEYTFQDASSTSKIAYSVSKRALLRTRNRIKRYYSKKISKNKKLTEEELNKFTAYIWTTAMNEVYGSIFNLYIDEKNKGNSVEANKIYNVLEAMKGWYLVNGVLNFKDTDNVTDMFEGDDRTLANYKVYILDYVKLVRNILSPQIARNLIDKEGNVTKYSSQYEIVQYNINSSDITIDVQNGNSLNGK